MLHPTGILICRLEIYSHHREQIGKDFMTIIYVHCYGPAGLCQGQESALVFLHISFANKKFYRAAYGRLGIAQIFADVDGADIVTLERQNV